MGDRSAVLALLFDVRVATLIGAALAGAPELGERLVNVARRESRLLPIGVHAIDAWAGRRVAPADCPKLADPAGWSTRGAHGLMAAYTMRHLPTWLRCSPWVLDVPLVSAFAAARRARSKACHRHPRCRSWLGMPSIR